MGPFIPNEVLTPMAEEPARRRELNSGAPAGDSDALQFEQSVTILDPMGNDLDNGQGSPACP